MYLVAILGIVRTHKYLGLHRNGDLIRAHSCGNKTNILAGSYCSKPYTTERETRNTTISGDLQIHWSSAASMTQPPIDDTIDPLTIKGNSNLVNLAPAQESNDGDNVSEPKLLPTPPQDSFKDVDSDLSIASTIEREEVIINDVPSPTPVPPHPTKVQKGDSNFAPTKIYPKIGATQEKKDSPIHKPWRGARYAGSDKSSGSSTKATEFPSPPTMSNPKQRNKLPKETYAMDKDDNQSRDVDADASNAQGTPLLPTADSVHQNAADPRDQNPGPSMRQDAPEPDGEDDPIVKKLRQQLWEQSLKHQWEMNQ